MIIIITAAPEWLAFLTKGVSVLQIERQRQEVKHLSQSQLSKGIGEPKMQVKTVCFRTLCVNHIIECCQVECLLIMGP